MIMRNLLIYTLSAILLLTASCSQEIDPVDQVQSGTITLKLENAIPMTKMAGVDDLNENLIESIHYFFYPKDGTDANTEKEPVKWNVLRGLSSQTLHTFRVNVSEDMLKNELFKYPYNDCDVYVIVNLPEDIDIETLPDCKLSTLKALAVQASFNSSLKQDSFVMEGLGKASIIDRKKILAAEGTIEVDRLAAKVSVGVSVRESITTMDNQTSTNNQTWTSVPKDMVIEFVNGVSNTILSGNPDDVAAFSYFNDANSNRTFSDADSDKVWTCAPFYSYPSKWDIGSEEEPYLRITLPWQTTIDTGVDGNDPPIIQTEKCIYKVILGGERLNRNTWNDLTIDIGILGNFENQEEVLLPIENTNYFVADWSTGKTISSEILGGRYLVVDQEEYILYNENTLSIPFTSSHACEIVDMSSLPDRGTITRPDYTTDIPDLDATVTWDSKWSFTIKDNVIHFEHVLNNDISNPPYDYAPYTIKFRIRHKDNGDVYYKDLTIIQYPAMMIENDQNTDYADDNDNSNDAGFVYINTNGTMYGSISGLSGNNANPNMYIITTTVLDAGSANILGDPRKTVVDNLNNNNWGSNPALYEGSTNRKLLYYYPTDDGTENVLAPKFRIASSYGKTSTLSFANAERRCASYQEDGYPAGRWRVPTKAELFFIITLTSDGLIPILFNNGGNYWAADGTVYSPNYNNDSVSEVNTTSAYVRCVYDDWYWENSKYARLDDIETFTWGDMPRESFQ